MFTLSDLTWFEPQIQPAISLAELKLRVAHNALFSEKQMNNYIITVKPVRWEDRQKGKQGN